MVLHAVAGEDPLLAVQRQVVGELARDDLGEQPRARQPLLDRLGRLGRHRDVPLAVPAGDLDPHVLDDEERGRPVVELLAPPLADLGAQQAAVGAGSLLRGDLVHPPLAGQVGRQRLAAVPLGPAGAGRSRRLCG